MKRPEYVSACVTACKKAINDEYNFDIEKDLHDLFSRSGFTDGYFEDKRGRNMFGYREKENVQSATKELLHKYASIYEKEQSRFTVNFNFSGTIGENAVLKASCNGKQVEVKSENLCEAPINRPIAVERIVDALKKCGGTQFEAGKVDIIGEVDYSLPISALNNMRRSALEILENEFSGISERKLYASPIPTVISSKNERKIYCR
jgi:putative protease